MEQTIYLALVDDWELRGTGTGDVETTQIEPMRKLMELYEKYGILGTFNVEVMQQLYMKRLGGRFPELKAQAAAWEQAVLDAHRRGHDIQLHIHAQWHNADYSPEKGWELNVCWDITQYPEEAVRSMFSDCIGYLRELFANEARPLNLVSFRSGAWCIAPSDFMLTVLADNNIQIDMSIVGGRKYNVHHCSLDYTHLEEDFLPFYPDMKDARKVSEKKEPIICIPTFSFYYPMSYKISNKISQFMGKKEPSLLSSPDKQCATEDTAYNEWEIKRSFIRKVVDFIKGVAQTADLSQLSTVQLDHMLRRIVEKSRSVPYPCVPVVLENHTKDISDVSAIEHFILNCRKNSGISFITMSKMAEMLSRGMFHVVKK